SERARVIHRPRKCYFKQLRLHPAGCQSWGGQVLASGGGWMAYGSTLSSFIYNMHDYSIRHILGCSVNIACMAANPLDASQLVMMSDNGHGGLWDVERGVRQCQASVNCTPVSLQWDPMPSGGERVGLATTKGHIFIWGLSDDNSGLTLLYERGATKSTKYDVPCPTALQWHPRDLGKITTAWTDGALISIDSSTGKSTKATPRPNEGIVDMQWDVLSAQYLLLGYRDGTVMLYDEEREEVLRSMEKRLPGLLTAQWMSWAPGTYMTVCNNSTLAQVWNISQDQPLWSIRLGNTGSPIVSAHMMTGAKGRGKVLSSSKDGAVAVHDMVSRRTEWSSGAGHTETIFACMFHPSDPNTLATSSYDSTVKIWHVPTMDLKLTLSPKTKKATKGVLYTVCWSPHADKVAAGSVNGSIFIWDAESGKILSHLEHHSKAVYKVHWNPHNHRRLASSSADGKCMIFDSSGTLIRQYCHSSPLFGCEWSPHYGTMLAVALQTGEVRVYNTESLISSQYLSLRGHSARTFQVHWSPLVPGLLASGSDDQSVRVWKMVPEMGTLLRTRKSNDPVTEVVSAWRVLKGHTHNVRPLFWSTEIPWLLITGSWDSTVRAWDVTPE
ncbi:unnamed protein product, partial [Chrysoparadoxa australica]